MITYRGRMTFSAFWSVMAILILLMLNLSNCSKPEEETTQDGVILPLSEGYTWKYTQDVVPENTFFSDIDTVIMEVVRADTMDGFVGYFVRNLIIEPIRFDDGSTMRLSNRDDGLYTATKYMFTEPSPPAIVERALPYPTVVGESIEYSGFNIVTKSISHPVTVPAGNFDCLWFEVYSDSSLLAEIWAQADIGIIRSWMQFGSIKIHHELTQYELAEPS